VPGAECLFEVCACPPRTIADHRGFCVSEGRQQQQKNYATAPARQSQPAFTNAAGQFLTDCQRKWASKIWAFWDKQNSKSEILCTIWKIFKSFRS
jgi:hypothetical protein